MGMHENLIYSHVMNGGQIDESLTSMKHGNDNIPIEVSKFPIIFDDETQLPKVI